MDWATAIFAGGIASVSSPGVSSPGGFLSLEAEVVGSAAPGVEEWEGSRSVGASGP